MQRSTTHIPSTAADQDWQSNVAKPLAPEEIRPGELVALLYQICELPSFLWCSDSGMLPADEPVRLRLVPECGGLPLKVKAVCLPYVLVALPRGGKQTLDVRQSQLARLSGPYGKAAWKAHKKSRGKKRRVGAKV